MPEAKVCEPRGLDNGYLMDKPVRVCILLPCPGRQLHSRLTLLEYPTSEPPNWVRVTTIVSVRNYQQPSEI